MKFYQLYTKPLLDFIGATVLFTNRERVKDMGRNNNRKYTEERFDVNIMNRDLISLFE